MTTVKWNRLPWEAVQSPFLVALSCTGKLPPAQDMGLFEQVYWKATKTIKELECHSYKNRLRGWGLVSLENRRVGVTLSMFKNIWWRGLKMEQDYSQWCPVTEEEAIGTKRKTRNSIWTQEKHFFIVREIKYWVKMQRGCGLSFPGDTENPTGRVPEQLALPDHSLRWGGGWTRQCLDVPSDLNWFMILCNSVGSCVGMTRLDKSLSLTVRCSTVETLCITATLQII